MLRRYLKVFYKPIIHCKYRKLIKKHGSENVEFLKEFLRFVIRLSHAAGPLNYFESYKFHSRYLKSFGFDFLGRGAFAQVFFHRPTGLAVKITGIMDDIDDYPAYVNWIERHPHLKHLPKIHYFEWVGKKYYFVFMDKYHNRDPDNNDWCYIGYILKGYRKNFEDLTGKLAVTGEYADSLLETCLALRELASGKSIDMHNGNIMEDEDGIPVITDPFSYSNS